ncbi:hypothetical protein M407DRAFT_29239 [Tulasnella calospora MUT 4182]|uniref:Uncharacterized protein n=1 Tax=Tulasnella calospora MUT 4182 TaxID=1051891 RepID=A0A0C3Q9A5_9AGAM|nr:hypothetical protein M407DRAFT_29239 [Tulasnella calospora MUT 4182]
MFCLTLPSVFLGFGLRKYPMRVTFPIHKRVIDAHPTAGCPLPGIFKTPWETKSEKERNQKDRPWGEFKTKEDWEFARFLMKSGLSQERIDELLQLEVTRARTQPSFWNKYEFFKKIDTLPRGPRFSCETVTITGDVLDERGMRMKEEVDLWLRDPIECIEDLLGKVTLRDCLVYQPTRMYTGEDRQKRVYSEMWTGDWWWNVQLSTFGGDKTAYPVYLTLGNIPKQIRREPSQRATILLGYLPVPWLACCSSTTQQLKGYEVFHTCMARLLWPMVSAGNRGVTLLCNDGRKRRVYPLLAAYCADFPEQCVVACVPENRCPKGKIGRDQRGGLDACEGRDPKATLEALQRLSECNAGPERRLELENLKSAGIRAVIQPFWRDLPHCNIFTALMPDILHQLHKGVFHAHLVNWCDKLMSAGELDRRFMSMANHPDLRHFTKGITTVKQWTGKEQRAMECVFVGAVAEGTNDSRVVAAARSLLDFIYLAQLPCHTSDTLAQLKDSLEEFHRNKSVFLENGVRSDFNIPKLHSLVHYSKSITGYGAADGYNTEYPERFHIEYAKLGYRASNKRDYERQMVTWLERQEAVDRFHSYIGWSLGAHSQVSSAIQTEHDENAEQLDDGARGAHQATSYTSELSAPCDGDENPEEPPDLDAANATLNYKQTSFRVAKNPPLVNTSILTIHRHFGIPDLVSSVNSYITQLAICQPQVHPQPISPFEMFNVYKCASLIVPPPAIGLPFWEDRIRATPAKVAGVLPSLGSRSFFDTVLVKTPPRNPKPRRSTGLLNKPSDASSTPINGEAPLSGSGAVLENKEAEKNAVNLSDSVDPTTTGDATTQAPSSGIVDQSHPYRKRL